MATKFLNSNLHNILTISKFTNFLRKTHGSTDVNTTEKALILIEEIKTDKPIAPVICTYNNIYELENLELGLKRTKSGVSAGLDGELKTNYLNNNKLQALSDKLKTHKYKPSPTKKV
jgi:hypothetical protein